MIKVNLFIVGAAKAGTTSLFSYLREHPDIFIPKEKEPHYFSTDLHIESDQFHKYHNQTYKFPYRDEEKYKQLYSSVNKQKYFGDASTSYLISKEASVNIWNYNPEAKIIIILRDPAQAVWSYYWWLKNRMEENMPFRKAWKLEHIRKKEINRISRYARFPSRVYYSEAYSYCEQVKRYLDVFPQSNIKVIISEHMFVNPDMVYNDTLKFLGLPSYDIKKSIVENKTTEYYIGGQIIYDLIDLKRKIFPYKVNKKISHFIVSSFFKSHKKKILDRKTLKMLKNHYRSDVKKTGELLKIDLTGFWNY